MLSVDDDFCSMLGYTKSDLIVFCRNKTRLLIYEPDDQMYNSSVVRDLIERGWYSIKHRMRCRNGELLWVWNYGSLEKDIQGKQVIRSVIFDINESVRLRRNLECMVQNVPGGVVRFLITETNFYVTWADDKDFDMKMLRSKVGLVFQYPEHQLFETDIFKDVCFGPKNLGLPKMEVELRAFGSAASCRAG